MGGGGDARVWWAWTITLTHEYSLHLLHRKKFQHAIILKAMAKIIARYKKTVTLLVVLLINFIGDHCYHTMEFR